MCDIFTILSSLYSSKAMDIDTIGPKLLKSCAISLCVPITQLFQQCIKLNQIPHEWKIHLITTILKNDDPSDVTNYRLKALFALCLRYWKKSSSTLSSLMFYLISLVIRLVLCQVAHVSNNSLPPFCLSTNISTVFLITLLTL